jgi:peptide-methionine (S)-S-oxide reductase
MKRFAAILLALAPIVARPAFAQGNAPKAKSPLTQTAVLAGGCFWGVEAVFEHTRGVVNVVSGYAGGTAQGADYHAVSSGRTKHAESVRVTYDPSKVSYEKLLEIFFSVVHDPTQLNRQGPDVGPQYRSAIFYANAEQQLAARNYIAKLTSAKAFKDPIVTEISPLDQFFMAEAEHQDFVAKNPDHPYVVYHDLPKLARLRAEFPAVFTGR